MQEIYKAWQNLIDAMLRAADKASDESMDSFNEHARSVNVAVSHFLNEQNAL